MGRKGEAGSRSLKVLWCFIKSNGGEGEEHFGGVVKLLINVFYYLYKAFKISVSLYCH